MATFITLDDSPMFQKQIHSLEHITEELKDRCYRLYKGCRKYMEFLGEARNGDTMFAESLEVFSGGQDDPISMSIGGPIISKFINAFHELATYKELLRSQVEHVLVDRLAQFLSVDLKDTKDSRWRFDKASQTYDQTREKCASLKKSTRDEVVAEMEEDLHNSRSAFDKSRFNLVNALVNVETKKKYEFLESFSAIMDAHLRYFKLGYELLSQMEPFIHEVLTCVQQSKELADIEQDKLAKRIQEFRTQAELDQLRLSSNVGASTSSVGNNGGTIRSYKDIEAIMQSTAREGVQTIKQGYLLKRSSSLRANWKRRFFELDSLGNLYYHRHKVSKAVGSSSFHPSNKSDHKIHVFSRFRPRHHMASSHCVENPECCNIDLCASTIKIDAEDTTLRLCFRIISPSKTYTLQAENEAARIDWMNKITGVITSLLNSHLQQLHVGKDDMVNSNALNGVLFDVGPFNSNDGAHSETKVDRVDCVSSILRVIPGNELCAECNAPEPEWASLNLGILICIECSGVHRNLGVHISKVRSITLDVKVWEPTILELFRNLGNAYCNSIWEELLQLHEDMISQRNDLSLTSKPCANDPICMKEKYIQSKYVTKLLINKEGPSCLLPHATSIWEAVKTNNLREAYRLAVMLDIKMISTTYDEVVYANSYHDFHEDGSKTSFNNYEMKNYDPSVCMHIKDTSRAEDSMKGCSLLHLACHCGYIVMMELLLQFGADINRRDFHGRTPLHHCIAKKNNQLAKFLLKRGASASIKDGGGLSALERAMEMGAITDDELFLLLSESS